MGLTFEGKKNGKYQVTEHDPNVRLVFRGPDADKFEQVNPPRGPLVQLVNFELTVGWLKSTGAVPRDLPFDRCVLSVVGPHAGEEMEAIFKRKISDINATGRTYWLCQSPGARPERTQIFCEDTGDGDIPVFFLSPASPNGSRPTTGASVMHEWSPDGEVWTPLPDKLSPVTGQARSTAYALVLSALHLCNKEVDLAQFADAIDDKPVRFRLGASTLLAVPASPRPAPRMRRIVAVGHLAAPYSVWVR